ncbi:MAG: hypothetical protein CVU05_09200 [Bacteroidetes bacterium HGW-Bacteroidetes-21]|nr:MAG: hypothetical protein CVU05_09200 [Bacteroidetes bacterium HGW-Bacteroidetes-21]
MTTTPPDKKIIEFIKKHHVLTLATAEENQPWCSNCFYAYLEKENLFCFTSDEHTRHVQHLKNNNKVAASIVLETKIIGKIQGLQLTGIVTEPEGELLKSVRNRFLKRFPYAILKDTTMWCLSPDFFKLTDNRLGFGKKLYWPYKPEE